MDRKGLSNRFDKCLQTLRAVGQEHLLGQWAFVECPPGVRKAGEAIINYIDSEGYFRTDFDAVIKESKAPLTLEDLQEALRLVQTLDPPGVGARNLQECLLIQLDALHQDAEASEGHDFELERALITEHLKHGRHLASRL